MKTTRAKVMTEIRQKNKIHAERGTTLKVKLDEEKNIVLTRIDKWSDFEFSESFKVKEDELEVYSADILAQEILSRFYYAGAGTGYREEFTFD